MGEIYDDGVIRIKDNRLIKYMGKTPDVVIPEGVTEIRDSAFSSFTGMSKLTSVVIPNSVKKIGAWAFKNNLNLKRVILPKGLTTIEHETFSSCRGLEEIVIPESVKTIEAFAFLDCKSLCSIEIPKGTVMIGRQAFGGCAKIKKVIIPEGVTLISANMFTGCLELCEVKLPEGLKVIGDEAFKDCASLTSIVIPKTVEEIGEDVFKNCDKLKSVFAVNYDLNNTKDVFLKRLLCIGYMENSETYSEELSLSYAKYANGQRKKLLEEIFRNDNVKALQYYVKIKKVTSKNVAKEYLEPAIAENAVQCIEYLQQNF